MKNIIIASRILHELEATNTILTRNSITFLPAESSEQILRIQDEIRADLIITDASLPLMGGVKLCSRIRGAPELKYVSIIVLGDDDDTSLAQCREAGANMVLQNPVDGGTLLWKASELLVVPQRKDMRSTLGVSIQGMKGNKPFVAESLNISISGMLLSSDHELIQGDVLTCSFSIGHSEISLNCVVVRVDATAPGSYQYGVRFVNCDRRTLVIIDQFIKKLQGQ